jgi:hypothetical protein
MVEQLVFDAIKDFGFPVVAFLLMYHLIRTSLKDNTMAIRELVVVIEQLMGRLR